MTKTVYNIVWADDEVDELLDVDGMEDLEANGFKVIAIAHNGEELSGFVLEWSSKVDAVIVDANFHRNEENVVNERDTTGLESAIHLKKLLMSQNKGIPFFLYSGRSEEMMNICDYDRTLFAETFPRNKRWFRKGDLEEYRNMLTAIKEAVDENKSTAFVVRNKYQYELNAASLLDGTDEFIFDFLIRDHDNTLQEMNEPFVSVRRSIEKIFGYCSDLNLIPPINDNTNGTANYFLNNKYSVKDEVTGKMVPLYEMLDGDIMPKPLAFSLKYIVDISQDASHSKNGLRLKVDEYFTETQDVLLLRSVVYILIDVIKWFAITAMNNKDEELNAVKFWRKIEN